MRDSYRLARYAVALRPAYGRAALMADVDVPEHLARAAMEVADAEMAERWEEFKILAEQVAEARRDLKRACASRDEWQERAAKWQERAQASEPDAGISQEQRAQVWDAGYREAKPQDSQEYRDILNPYRAPFHDY